MFRRLACIALCAAAYGQSTTPTITAVTNTFNFSTTLCPGLVATVFGSNFGTDATKASVMIGGKAAYVSAMGFSPTQFVIQIPMELAPGPTSMTVTINGIASSGMALTLSTVSPALQSADGSGIGLAAVYTADTGKLLTQTSPGVSNQNLVVYAAGLGITSPATPTGIVASGVINQVSPLPKLTIGGVDCKVAYAGVVTGSAGLYQINFAVPSSGVQGTEPLVITIQGQSSSSLLTIPLIGTSAVVNNASFANPGTMAPGTIASVFANGLGAASINELSVFPNTTSQGVKVTFNGEASPLFHLIPGATPQQIDLFVPSDLPTSGTVNVQLTTSSSNYQNYTLNMVPASPGFYRFTDMNDCKAGVCTQYVIAQFANSAWLALPASTTTTLKLPACAANTPALTQCGEPANIGDYLVLYLTGLGRATVNGDAAGATLPTGHNPPADGSTLYETPAKPTVTIGGIDAPVLFSGLVPGYAGEYQLDVQVPPGVTNGDQIPVKVTMMGASDTTNISIQPTRVKPPNQ